MSIQQLDSLLKQFEIVELGHYLEENIPVHPSHSKFYSNEWHSMKLHDVCNDNQIMMNEHNGTHVDSFGHYINKPGYELIDAISIDRFCGQCIAIDASFLQKKETLEKEHIISWEFEHGEILENEIVLLSFGWEKYWRLRPEDKDFVTDYPGLGKTGAQYLMEKRVKMVGVDTLSVDACDAKGDPAHNILLSNRILIVENLMNIDKLFMKKGYFVMLPLLLRNGSASPVRPIVLV